VLERGIEQCGGSSWRFCGWGGEVEREKDCGRWVVGGFGREETERPDVLWKAFLEREKELEGWHHGGVSEEDLVFFFANF
jgi:hypothetical protein